MLPPEGSPDPPAAPVVAVTGPSRGQVREGSASGRGGDADVVVALLRPTKNTMTPAEAAAKSSRVVTSAAQVRAEAHIPAR